MKGRARTDVTEIRSGIVSAIETIRPTLDLSNPDIELAWAEVESFCAIALRVMAKTNPSKIRSEAMTVEIMARMDGRECLE